MIRHGHLPRDMKAKVCSKCGNEYHKPVDESNKAWLSSRYCSRKCSDSDSERFLRNTTVCPVCNMLHKINYALCRGKRNIYQKTYRHLKGISGVWKPKTTPIKKGNRMYPRTWDIIRKQVYERDRWLCQECGCKCQGKGYRKPKVKIQCHHIDYNTANNEMLNLITLCAGCHGKTNFKREDWINYFKRKVKNKQQ